MMRIVSIRSGLTLGIAALFLSAGTAMALPTVELSQSVTSVDVPYKTEAYQGPKLEKLVQNQISPAKAKAIALSRVRGGEYVDLRKSGNLYIVRVRAPNGQLLDIKIDATTGRVK